MGFFKNIRNRLSLSNDTILTFLPDIEDFLESDLVSLKTLDKFPTDYLNSTVLPKFDFIIDSDINNDQ